MKIYSEDFKNEKIFTFWKKQKKNFWKNWKNKTEDFSEDRKKHDLQNWSSIWTNIPAAPSVGFLKTIFKGDLQKEIFKTIKNTGEFALKICLK